jgi:hypothetical protein
MPPNGAISPADIGEMMPSLMPTMPFDGLGDAPDVADVAAVEPLPSLPCERSRAREG